MGLFSKTVSFPDVFRNEWFGSVTSMVIEENRLTIAEKESAKIFIHNKIQDLSLLGGIRFSTVHSSEEKHNIVIIPYQAKSPLEFDKVLLLGEFSMNNTPWRGIVDVLAKNRYSVTNYKGHVYSTETVMALISKNKVLFEKWIDLNVENSDLAIPNKIGISYQLSVLTSLLYLSRVMANTREKEILNKVLAPACGFCIPNENLKIELVHMIELASGINISNLLDIKNYVASILCGSYKKLLANEDVSFIDNVLQNIIEYYE